ncbi:electron transporter RnfD [Flavobacterium cupreum]|uniref:Electron transporter RnfD n=2 Tax=Flavobacterium TaxID=237 RepID=A0A4Y7UDK2_9FLAO|nr:MULTISPECIES: SGNH/GDSL hydrolase family protein [Flavobacterium]RUT68008.1 electron transporter RnfD [Flavobacterium cupreum]TCN59005.1 GDSL-like lipase/acylhydrolase family protein [Flavobacterium circumlabens]TEB44533.1 electron transporter RnfD [Flavobacterium circumlabens]
MRFNNRYFFIFLFFTAGIIQSQSKQEKIIAANNPLIDYMGRVSLQNDYADFYWTGSSVSITIKNTKVVQATIESEKADNYYYVIVDGKKEYAKKIKINKGKKKYTLAVFSDNKKHHLELFKITDTNGLTTRFYGFITDKNSKVLKNKKKKRKIEFFGDSITAGHGVDVPVDSTDSGAAKYFNNYKTYAAITARYFNAEYHCTAKSGIGVMASWFPEIMPEIYNRLNPNDAKSVWEFGKYQPDIVVVNLFQNDSWIVNMPNEAQFQARFGTVKPSEEQVINSYMNFIKSLRNVYPNAHIICCLGNMDATRKTSKWPDYVDKTIASLGDLKVKSCFFEYKNTPGHPKEKEQLVMAETLIKFIENQKLW